MAPKRKKSKEGKKKVKKWFTVTCPLMFSNNSLGEVPTTELNNLLHRQMTLNLSACTRDFRHQDTSVSFRITNLSGNVAEAEIISYKLAPASLKRIVRRKTDRVDLITQVTIKDNVKVVAKIVVMTLNNTYHGVRNKLRAAAEISFKEVVKNKSYVEIVQSLIQNRLPRELKKIITKVFPTRFVVIKEFTILGKPKKSEVKVKPVEEPEEKPTELVKEEKPAKEEKAEEKPAEKPKVEEKAAPKKAPAKKAPAKKAPAKKAPAKKPAKK